MDTLTQFPAATIERYWAKVMKSDNPDDCWGWTASLRAKGYGAFGYTFNGIAVQERAHRFSYMLHVGPIPEGVFVLHTCDNPPCSNPRHLFLGTNLDNIKDMLSKGRHVPGGTHCGLGAYGKGKYRKGLDHHNTRLTEALVLAIRADHATGAYSYQKLADKYGIVIAHAHKIVTRKVWKHI